MRAKQGAAVELFDGRGTLGEGVVQHVDKKRTVVRVHNIISTPAATTGRIILAVSFAKGQRFDWLVEKCTELGVDHIAAVQFERSVKLGKRTALDRYHKISIGAAKQSKRLFLPEISGPEKLPRTLASLGAQYPQNLFLYGDPKGVGLFNLSDVKGEQDCIVVVGPEGGFSDHETALLAANNATGVTLNRNTLRIETAAVAFCATLAATRL